VTVRNLRVLQVDAKQHLLIVNGAVPGAPGGLLMVRKAVAAKLQRAPVAEAPKKKKRK
jgi:ribosomal protein L3